MGFILLALGAWRINTAKDGFSIITGFYVILAGAILAVAGMIVGAG